MLMGALKVSGGGGTLKTKTDTISVPSGGTSVTLPSDLTSIVAVNVYLTNVGTSYSGTGFVDDDGTAYKTNMNQLNYPNYPIKTLTQTSLVLQYDNAQQMTYKLWYK